MRSIWPLNSRVGGLDGANTANLILEEPPFTVRITFCISYPIRQRYDDACSALVPVLVTDPPLEVMTGQILDEA
jgi:hypothetical protein